jgi:acyl carrier protein
MSDTDNSKLQHLKDFLRTIQRPNAPIDRIGINDDLVQSGLIDSLAMIQIVAYLEQSYNIDFSLRGFDPERLASMKNILELIDEVGE